MGSEGYYYSLPVALEKVEENLYKKIDKNFVMEPYRTGTKEFLTVANVVPLSSLTDNKGTTTISERKITLHLLKYCLNAKNRDVSLFKDTEERCKKLYSMQKNK